jgi:hypothetical protein
LEVALQSLKAVALMAVALEAAALEVATAAHYHPLCATKNTPVSTPGEVAT